MKKIVKLLIPAFIAVALFASCEDKMDEMVVKDGSSIETLDKMGLLPPDKDKIKVPPGL